jgi:hypothetical protein
MPTPPCPERLHSYSFTLFTGQCHNVKDRTAAARRLLEDFLLPCARMLSVDKTLAAKMTSAMAKLSDDEKRKMTDEVMLLPLPITNEWKAHHLLHGIHTKYVGNNEQWHKVNAGWLETHGAEPGIASLLQARQVELKFHEESLTALKTRMTAIEATYHEAQLVKKSVKDMTRAAETNSKRESEAESDMSHEEFELDQEDSEDGEDADTDVDVTVHDDKAPGNQLPGGRDL